MMPLLLVAARRCHLWPICQKWLNAHPLSNHGKLSVVSFHG